jgi:hypothetical protein
MAVGLKFDRSVGSNIKARARPRPRGRSALRCLARYSMALASHPQTLAKAGIPPPSGVKDAVRGQDRQHGASYSAAPPFSNPKDRRATSRIRSLGYNASLDASQSFVTGAIDWYQCPWGASE